MGVGGSFFFLKFGFFFKLMSHHAKRAMFQFYYKLYAFFFSMA